MIYINSNNLGYNVFSVVSECVYNLLE